MYEKLNSVEGALELLRSAVKERGADYVYQEDPNNVTYNADATTGGDISPLFDSIGCQYAVRDDNNELIPACIVGVAIYTEEGPKGLDNVHQLYEGKSVCGLAFLTNYDALDVLGMAQRIQDEGGNWGRALEEAEKSAQRIIGNQEEAVEE